VRHHSGMVITGWSDDFSNNCMRCSGSGFGCPVGVEPCPPNGTAQVVA
jgi:hypothetical protein